MEAMTAVIRRDADYYFAPVNMARDQGQAGKVRPIAVASPERDPNLPNIPTFTEAGLPFVYDSWFGLMAPAGVPSSILDKVSTEWAEILKSPDVQARLKNQFLVAKSDTPAAMDAIIRKETESLTVSFKEAGLLN
jgi:tripartite-type tricarboxylate transporter receptor subunit TctC